MSDDMPFSYQEFFQRQIAEMTARFQREKDLARDRFVPPSWVKGHPASGNLPARPTDPLAVIYRDVGLLYEKGQLVYGMLLQANDALFHFFPHMDAPGNAVFSTDAHYRSYPSELFRLAEELYSYKGMEDVPEDLRQIVGAITDEITRLLNVPLPADRFQGRRIYHTTLMFHRRHLPHRRLTGRVFPLLVAPELTPASVMLPCRYWTREFIRQCW